MAVPQATRMAQGLFIDPLESLAAYLFTCAEITLLSMGTKHTPLATCLVFLSENGLLRDERLDADA